jgi:hypothetical protein
MLTGVAGVIAEGLALTVTMAVALQIPPTEYVIVVVPGVNAFTIPLDEPIVAMAPLLLVHIPAGAVLPNGDVLPTHTLNVPVMGPGDVTIVSTENTELLPHELAIV